MSRLFSEKWNTMIRLGQEERDLFVRPGAFPRTQRQFNLFHYYRFLARRILDRGYRRGVEFGCGRGTLSQYLAVYHGMEMTLLDNSEHALDLARTNFAKVGARAEYLCADAAASGLPSDSFDFVFSIGLLEHIPDYGTVLREKFRVLRPGGFLFALNVPGKISVQNLNNLYKRLISPFVPVGFLRKDYYRNEDTPDQYLAAARKTGFVDCSVMNVNPYPIWTPVPAFAERFLASSYRAIHRLRGLVMEEPMKTNYLASQGHFLTGFKPGEGSETLFR